MEIKMYEEKYFDSLNILLEEVFHVSKKDKELSSNFELLAIDGENVIGYLMLNPLYDSIRCQKYFYVNYVCTHPNYRNQHVATKLFDRIFSICKEEGVSYLELTSNPSRVVAHHLYHKLGFQVRETTVFRKEIL